MDEENNRAVLTIHNDNRQAFFDAIEQTNFEGYKIKAEKLTNHDVSNNYKVTGDHRAFFWLGLNFEKNRSKNKSRSSIQAI